MSDGFAGSLLPPSLSHCASTTTPSHLHCDPFPLIMTPVLPLGPGQPVCAPDVSSLGPSWHISLSPSTRLPPLTSPCPLLLLLPPRASPGSFGICVCTVRCAGAWSHLHSPPLPVMMRPHGAGHCRRAGTPLPPVWAHHSPVSSRSSRAHRGPAVPPPL